jgi:hypothetical protein
MNMHINIEIATWKPMMVGILKMGRKNVRNITIFQAT